MKCISKFINNEKIYDKRSDQEAKRLVESEGWEYISKEEYKNRSKFNKFIPCKGTFIRTTEVRDGQKVIVYRLVNEINHIKKNIKAIRNQYPNSSKLSKYSMNLNIRRKGKFNSQNLTLFDIYKLPLWKFLKEDDFDILKDEEGRRILKERKIEFIKNFKRVLN